MRESAVWLATGDDDGRLAACNPDTELLDFACEDCGAEYDLAEFSGIDFN